MCVCVGGAIALCEMIGGVLRLLCEMIGGVLRYYMCVCRVLLRCVR